jgi:hypothetical protein
VGVVHIAFDELNCTPPRPFFSYVCDGFFPDVSPLLGVFELPLALFPFLV